jgi:hypothetical protein
MKFFYYQWLLLPVAASVILIHNNYDKINSYLIKKFPPTFEVKENRQPTYFNFQCPNSSNAEEDACEDLQVRTMCAGHGVWHIMNRTYTNGLSFNKVEGYCK